MVASSTKRRFKKKQPYEKLGLTQTEVETAAKITTEYLKDWTVKESRSIALKENSPICIPSGNKGFLVGRYHMQEITAECFRVVDHNQEFVYDFGHRLSAIFYCYCSHINRINLARCIIESDQRVVKLKQDKDFYANTIKVSAKKQDFFRLDVANMRHAQAQEQLKFAIEELQKTINTAKYLKVQETQL